MYGLLHELPMEIKQLNASQGPRMNKVWAAPGQWLIKIHQIQMQFKTLGVVLLLRFLWWGYVFDWTHSL